MHYDASSESIHPKLHRALDCLDVRLEDELTRYRRQRSGQSLASVVAPPKPKPARKATDFLLLNAGTASTPQLAGANAAPKALSQDQDRPSPSGSAGLALLSPESDVENTTLPQPETIETFAPVSLDRHSDLAESEPPETDAPPDDYLESSEELLRSLARQEAQVEVERSFLESLLTPLGVGSMLTLLLSSAMFGYVIMNPASLRNLGNAFAARREAIPVAKPTAASSSSSSEMPNAVPLDSQEFVDLGLNNLATLKSAPRGGNAAISAERNSVGTAPSPSPQPSAAPSAESSKSSGTQPSGGTVTALPAPRFSSASPTAATVTNGGATSGIAQRATPRREAEPVAASSSANRRSSSQSRDRPAAAKPYNPPPIKSYSPPDPPARSDAQPVDVAPTSVSRTGAGGYSYKVEIPFTGDHSLDAARKVAPDAYLRPDGKIQLGAAQSQAEAQQKAQAFQDQGISADINQR
ncbi:hypothetical protein [Myxacorys almedinensis]|uniref:SPOR domain-containing protein n=1 Tax=Myxacorys almedinensis A TaxID=2690445 RepID=A0A8J7Z7C7_9CYAN|nr:hypothetical protein [Myxacorys almedinensis]NDJ16860.1 hypothetical protein [Myxacorys almedinensis A]